jgi:hypothetical protein
MSGYATNQALGNELSSPGTPLIVVYSINPRELSAAYTALRVAFRIRTTMTIDNVETRGSIVCPACSATLPYPVVNVARQFTCPSCDRKLMVAESYTKNLKTISCVLTLLVCIPLARQNIALLLFAPLVLFFVSMFTSIIGKRMIPPSVEDVEAQANKARYIAL